MIGRPRTRDLHLALAHHCAGGYEFILIALNTLAVDQVGDIQHHLAVIREAAADFLVERLEQSVHLEAYRSRTCLSFPSTRSIFPQIAQVFTANAFGRKPFLNFLRAAI